MATPIERRETPVLDDRTSVAGIAVDPVGMWAPPRGLDYISRLSRISNEYAAQLSNLRLQDGTLVSRPGTASVGTTQEQSDPNYLLGVVNFVTTDGLGYLVRFRNSTDVIVSDDFWVQVWDGVSSWNGVSGSTVLVGGATDYITSTGWNDKLIFSNGYINVPETGLHEFNPAAGSTRVIPEGPACRYLTTFNSRLIASHVSDPVEKPARIQWSVKNNSNDWTGIGSGFEDLLSTPGGILDPAMGVWPVSDYTALVLRRNSVWQMNASGREDAPFTFNRLYAEMGTESPYSMAAIPGGVVGLFDDDIYVISERDVKPIGSRIRRQIRSEIVDPRDCMGAYDPDERTYYFTTGSSILYSYSFRDEGWSRDVYPFGIKWITNASSTKIPLSIDSATGDHDSAGDLSIDSEFGTEARSGLYFVSTSLTTTGCGSPDEENVVKADPALTADFSGCDQTPYDAALVAQTGFLKAPDPLRFTSILEIQMEYEALEDQTLIFEYRRDTGDSWTPYSQKAVTVTNGPTLLSVRKTLEDYQMQLQLRTTTLGALRILFFAPHIISGAKVHI